MASVPFPLVYTSDRLVNQLQQNIYQALQAPLSQPQTLGRIITGEALSSGANVVNHGLGRPLQGWQIVRQRASATIYDTQDTNTHPQLTLNLTASAAVTVDIFVF